VSILKKEEKEAKEVRASTNPFSPNLTLLFRNSKGRKLVLRPRRPCELRRP